MTWVAHRLVLLAAIAQPLFLPAEVSGSEQEILRQIEQSGRCAELGQSAQERVAKLPRIAPGQPPILSFKYYEDAKHHRFGNVDVMLDDAGH